MNISHANHKKGARVKMATSSKRNTIGDMRSESEKFEGIDKKESALFTENESTLLSSEAEFDESNHDDDYIVVFHYGRDNNDNDEDENDSVPTKFNSISFSPRGDLIVTTSGEIDNYTLHVLDWRSKKYVLNENDHPAPCNDASFSPDGSQIVTGCDDAKIRLFETQSLSLLQILEGWKLSGLVKSVSFSSSGEEIVSCGYDMRARVYQLNSEEASSESEAIHFHPRGMTKDQGGIVNDIHMSPCCLYFATACEDGHMRVFCSMSANMLYKSLKHEGAVTTIRYSPNGHMIATGSNRGKIRIFRKLSKNQFIIHHESSTYPGPILNVEYSNPNGTDLLVAFKGDKTKPSGFKLFLASSSAIVHESPKDDHGSFVSNVSFSPNGLVLLTACYDTNLRAYITSNMEMVHAEEDDHKGIIWDVRYNLKGDSIVTACKDGFVRVYDASHLILVARSERTGESIRTASFSPDATRVVCASETGVVRLYEYSHDKNHLDSNENQKVKTLKLLGVCDRSVFGGSELRVAEFTPDSRYVACAGWGVDVTFLPTDDISARKNSGKILFTGDPSKSYFGVCVTALDIDRKGSKMIVGDLLGFFRVYKLQETQLSNDVMAGNEELSFKLIYQSRLTGDSVRGIEFSPNGRNFVVACKNKRLLFYDAKAFAVLDSFEHHGDLRSARFSNCGSYLATASDDKKARIFYVEDLKLLHDDVAAHLSTMAKSQFVNHQTLTECCKHAIARCPFVPYWSLLPLALLDYRVLHGRCMILELHSMIEHYISAHDEIPSTCEEVCFHQGLMNWRLSFSLCWNDKRQLSGKIRAATNLGEDSHLATRKELNKARSQYKREKRKGSSSIMFRNIRSWGSRIESSGESILNDEEDEDFHRLRSKTIFRDEEGFSFHEDDMYVSYDVLDKTWTYNGFPTTSTYEGWRHVESLVHALNASLPQDDARRWAALSQKDFIYLPGRKQPLNILELAACAKAEAAAESMLRLFSKAPLDFEWTDVNGLACGAWGLTEAMPQLAKIDRLAEVATKIKLIPLQHAKSANHHKFLTLKNDEKIATKMNSSAQDAIKADAWVQLYDRVSVTKTNHDFIDSGDASFNDLETESPCVEMLVPLPGSEEHLVHILQTLRENDVLEAFDTPLTEAMIQHLWPTVQYAFFYHFGAYLLFLFFFTSWSVMLAQMDGVPYDEQYLSDEREKYGKFSSEYFFTCGIMTLVGVVVFLGIEYWQLRRQRYNFWLYIQDTYNIVGLSTYICIIITLILHVSNQKEQFLLCSIAVTLAWLKSLEYSRAFEGMGVFTKTMGHIMSTVQSFMMVLLTFVFAFAFGFYTLYREQVSGFDSPYEAFMSVWLLALGDFGFIVRPGKDALHKQDDESFRIVSDNIKSNGFHDDGGVHGPRYYIQLVLVYLFTFVTTIILLNVLIAIISDAHEEIQQESKKRWRMEQVDLILELRSLLQMHNKPNRNGQGISTESGRREILDRGGGWLHVLVPVSGTEGEFWTSTPGTEELTATDALQQIKADFVELTEKSNESIERRFHVLEESITKLTHLHEWIHDQNLNDPIWLQQIPSSKSGLNVAGMIDFDKDDDQDGEDIYYRSGGAGSPAFGLPERMALSRNNSIVQYRQRSSLSSPGRMSVV